MAVLDAYLNRDIESEDWPKALAEVRAWCQRRHEVIFKNRKTPSQYLSIEANIISKLKSMGLNVTAAKLDSHRPGTVVIQPSASGLTLRDLDLIKAAFLVNSEEIRVTLSGVVVMVGVTGISNDGTPIKVLF